jgi:hypothetical protein
MAYRRQWHASSWQSNKPVIVTLSWNSLVGAYDLKFDQIYGDEKWGKVKGIIAWLKKTVPYGERDYDDVTKVWTVHEKYFTVLRDIINAMGAEFTVTIVEKPIGGPAIKFTPLDTYFKIFEYSSGVDISSYPESEFNQAKKIYFRTVMKLHPDKGGDPVEMSNFNIAWDAIKERHFKIKRVMEQIAD